MKTVILAGGLGTRLAPYTTILPKPLMPLNTRPILEIVICQLREHGFTDITMAVGYLSHLLQAYFEDGRRFGVNIHYSYEEKPMGTAGPLTLLPPTDEPILVMNGDILTGITASAAPVRVPAMYPAASIGVFSSGSDFFWLLIASDGRRSVSGSGYRCVTRSRMKLLAWAPTNSTAR